LAKSNSGDNKGAIADLNIAIRLDPQLDNAYNNRGSAKSKLGENKGAISDYDLAIRLNPQYAGAYANRGLVKALLGDKTGAIADLNIAAKLFKAQSNPDFYEKAMGLIRQLSN
jgi:tetratricopeptide (TPR) repeat protein